MTKKKHRHSASGVSAFKNEVIVFGADHSNTLGVLRCLSEAGCCLQLLIHRSVSHGWSGTPCIASSRYARQVSALAEDPGVILEWLERQADPAVKKIVLPCSDFAAHLLDTHFQKLAEHYLLPGFQGQPGQVACMMDKYHQKEFAEAHGIPMAKSWSLRRGQAGFAMPADAVYPCIFKPQLSAAGKKSDIRVAANPQEAADCLMELAAKGYRELLLQEYLEMEYEALGIGCIVSDSPGVFHINMRKLRVWPIHGGGSTACARCEENPAVAAVLECITASLRRQGYRGMYDIELFVCRDAVYLNEINFRNSATGCMLNDCGIPAAYLSCLDLLGLPLPPCPETVREGVYIDEINDLYGRRDNHLSLSSLLKDVVRADSRAVFSWRDLRGSWGFYRPVFAKAFAKRWRRFTHKRYG